MPPRKAKSREDSQSLLSIVPVGSGTLASRSAPHRTTRRAHSTELAEDYVETIADLIDTRGEARVTDIAQSLGVSHVTVVRTVARLQRSRLVTARPYRSIFLTPAGRKLAEQSRRRHQVILRFLQVIGVPEKAAHADAEGLEHHVSEETLAALERFVAARP
jgi:DtxR family manganese transport transcriptional regulator